MNPETPNLIMLQKTQSMWIYNFTNFTETLYFQEIESHEKSSVTSCTFLAE